MNSVVQNSQSDNDQFYYFLCNPGSEAFLKEEIKLLYHELRFAYSTEGFVTFKEIRALGKTLRPVFCRHFGKFIKRSESLEEIKESIPKGKNFLFYSKDGEIKNSYEYNLGEKVFEIIEVKVKEKTQYYLGEFNHSHLNSPVPGGFFHFPLPELSPSRAYLKAKEAVAYTRSELQAGQKTLEIGSSPGGASYALLESGLHVEGVDPGLMDDICFSHPNFIHHHKSIQEFRVHELKNHIEWLFVDMNLPPEGTIRELEKVVEKIRPSLKGAFITLKMTKFENVSRVPMYLNFIGKLGLNVVLATQLESHKQEFLVFAE